MKKLFRVITLTSLIFLFVGLYLSCSTKSPPTLNSITTRPTGGISSAINYTYPITVTAYYADGSSKNITLLSTYVSSNESIATVTNNGEVKGISPGSAQITVSYTENGITKTSMFPTIWW